MTLDIDKEGNGGHGNGLLTDAEDAEALQKGDLGWEVVQWKDLQVGDVVSVRNREFIPADLIVLASTNDNGENLENGK
jgi:magnesium-transporting ATPase (P-type)